MNKEPVSVYGMSDQTDVERDRCREQRRGRREGKGNRCRMMEERQGWPGEEREKNSENEVESKGTNVILYLLAFTNG